MSWRSEPYLFTYVTSVPRQQGSGLGVIGRSVHPSPTRVPAPAIVDILISKIDGCIFVFEFDYEKGTRIQIEFKFTMCEKGQQDP